MSKLLRGNFQTKGDVKAEKGEDDLETKFERAALARLGGSIGYVSRKKFLWNGDGEGDPKEMPAAGRAAQYDGE
ncbi:MAG: hypothetical protein ACLPKB_14215 [Xanthobacteraceae bacterium]|jgi:hypothetical protein